MSATKSVVMGSNDTAEILVLESTVDLCDRVRCKLQEKFSFIWLYVCTKSPKSNSARITVSNASGGQLDRVTANEIIRTAKKYHDQLKD